MIKFNLPSELYEAFLFIHENQIPRWKAQRLIKDILKEYWVNPFPGEEPEDNVE
jgi:hypothetical protein